MIGNLQENIIFYSGSILFALLISFHFFIILLKHKYVVIFVIVIVFVLSWYLFHIFSYMNRREIIAVLKTRLWLTPLIY